MSHELLYTSAPRGLRPGSQGFCTVAATDGLPPPLLERLEALAAYQPAFPPHDPRAAQNPVVHAHYRLDWSSRRLHVLTRICAAGLDYSGRHNKFAHQVVLADEECPPSGPAWLLQQPGFLKTAWDGCVTILPAGRTPPLGSPPVGPCRHWQQAVGDAGWAGVLADAFLRDPSRVAYLLYAPGFDPLPVLAEAAGLLSSAERWDLTFSTYYTGAIPGSPCQWRCVLADTPAAAEATKARGAMIINLTAPLGPAPDGERVHQARTGIAPPERRRTEPVAPLPVPDFAAPARPLPEREPLRYVAQEVAPAAPEPAPVVRATAPLPRDPSPAPVTVAPSKSAAGLFTGLAVGLAVGLLLAVGGFALGRFLPQDGTGSTVGAGSDEVQVVQDKDSIRGGLSILNSKAQGAAGPARDACVKDLSAALGQAGFRNLDALLKGTNKEVADLRATRTSLKSTVAARDQTIREKESDNDGLRKQVAGLQRETGEQKRQLEVRDRKLELAGEVLEVKKQLLSLPEAAYSSQALLPRIRVVAAKAAALAGRLPLTREDEKQLKTDTQELVGDAKKLADEAAKLPPLGNEPKELSMGRAKVVSMFALLDKSNIAQARHLRKEAEDLLEKVTKAHAGSAHAEMANDLLRILRVMDHFLSQANPGKVKGKN